VWLKKPNLFRIETSLDRGFSYEGGVAIGDGKAWWFFWPQGRWKADHEDAELYEATRLTSYAKFPFPMGTDHFIGTHGYIGANPVLNPGAFFGFTKFAPNEVDGMRRLPAEKVNGEECERIEASLIKHEESWYFWLSTRDHLPRRIKRIIRASYDIVGEEEWTSVKLNDDIPDRLFVWAPPSGWKEFKSPTSQDRLLKCGTKAPDFELASADGKPIKLSDYRGQVVWFFIWRAGCPSCREEMGPLQAIYAKYRDKGLVVLGFNDGGDARKFALEFMADNGVTFPNIVDSSESARKVSLQDYRVCGYSTNYIIDRDGRIADAWAGGYEKGLTRGLAALAKTGGALADAIQKDTAAEIRPER
jgi:peroxiredoxin